MTAAHSSRRSHRRVVARPDTKTVETMGDPTRNLRPDMTAILGHLGIATTHSRDTVEGLVARELARLGVEAQVSELRYGVLTVTCSPVAARLLRYDQDQILAVVARAAPGAVSSLRIRSQTSGAVRRNVSGQDRPS